jgi:hypothetical protein
MAKMLIIMLLIASSAMAQKNGDNTALIENFSSFDELKTAIITNFYTLENFDSSGFSTKPKPTEGSVYAYDLKVSLHGVLIYGNLYLWSEYSFELQKNKYSGRGEFSRRSLIGKTIAFNEMKKIADQFNAQYIKK